MLHRFLTDKALRSLARARRIHRLRGLSARRWISPEDVEMKLPGRLLAEALIGLPAGMVFGLFFLSIGGC